jgi:hypothetical protein
MILWFVKESAPNTKQTELMELIDTSKDKRCAQYVIFLSGGTVSTVRVVILCYELDPETPKIDTSYK